MPVEIITTGDGSHSLFNRDLDETYHSRHGAVRESDHVFIEHGLNFFAGNHPGKKISVFEVGFGTGLNALLALSVAEVLKVHVDYTTVEAFPIDAEVAMALNYVEEVSRRPNSTVAPTISPEIAFSGFHQSTWNVPVAFGAYFTFTKIHGRLEDVVLQKDFDVIFFDAFAPSKQPGMWTNDLLGKVVGRMTDGAVFVTYCAKGQVKRDLAGLGLKVETLPGPPGKKEMTRATKV